MYIWRWFWSNWLTSWVLSWSIRSDENVSMKLRQGLLSSSRSADLRSSSFSGLFKWIDSICISLGSISHQFSFSARAWLTTIKILLIFFSLLFWKLYKLLKVNIFCNIINIPLTRFEPFYVCIHKWGEEFIVRLCLD